MYKKIDFRLLTLLMVALFSCSLLSCSSDDDDNDNEEDVQSSIYGTWKYEFSSGYQLMTFNQNGTYLLQEIDDEDGDWSDEGTFTYRDGTLILDGEEKFQVYSITSSKMVIRLTHIYEDGEWEYVDEDTKDGQKMTLKRVK